jgi:hypothetical protein
MFGFFKRKRIGGEIAFYRLQDWWLSSFTSEEHDYIIRKYKPLGTGTSNGLINGSISWSSQSAISFLQNLSGWFNNPRDRHIALRILNKAEELSGKLHFGGGTGNLTKEEADNILDHHFLYLQIIKTFYPLRNSQPGALEKVIEACRNQIDLSSLAEKAFRKNYRGEPLPVHTGYEQLAIILEKQKKFQEALDLCKEASKTKWRGGCWEARIERLSKKLHMENLK